LFLLNKLPLQCDELLDQKYSSQLFIPSQQAAAAVRRTFGSEILVAVIYSFSTSCRCSATNFWIRNTRRSYFIPSQQAAAAVRRTFGSEILVAERPPFAKGNFEKDDCTADCFYRKIRESATS
jgi:hypothetical protein